MKTFVLVLLLSSVVSAGLAHSSRAQEPPESAPPPYHQGPQAWINYYEGEINKCKEYLDELSLMKNKAEILFADARQRHPRSSFAGWTWSKQFDRIQTELNVTCFRIERYQQNIQEQRDKLPPDPSPTPTPDPSASPTPPAEDKPLKSVNDKRLREFNDRQVKFAEAHKQKINELKVALNKIVKEIEDYAKTVKPNQPPPGFKAETTSGDGLSTTTIITPQGKLVVHLPADSRAGDTLSGTVVAEPQGETEQEKDKNLRILARYQLRITNQRILPPWGVFTWNWPPVNRGLPPAGQNAQPPANTNAGGPPLIELLAPPGIATPEAAPVVTAHPEAAPVVAATPETAPVVTGTPEVAPVVAAHPEAAPAVAATPDAAPVLAVSPELAPVVGVSDSPSASVVNEVAAQPPSTTSTTLFQLPMIGQNGRMVMIKGPFDGNTRTTQIRVGGQPVTVLAESPRNCIFRSPAENLGPTEISVSESGVETKGTYRNIGVRLSAPKTNLLKGESTTVTITVEGLKGIQQNIPLLLEKEGDVSMEGGDVQTIQIRPNDVVILGTESRADVRKVVVGLRPGFFNITATIIDPRIRPIIIPLVENGGVNGYRVKKDGTGFVVNVENVKHPITGDPVDGEHKLEHGCTSRDKIPYISRLFLNKGIGKTKSECLIMITPRIIIQD